MPVKPGGWVPTLTAGKAARPLGVWAAPTSIPDAHPTPALRTLGCDSTEVSKVTKDNRVENDGPGGKEIKFYFFLTFKTTKPNGQGRMQGALQERLTVHTGFPRRIHFSLF